MYSNFLKSLSTRAVIKFTVVFCFDEIGEKKNKYIFLKAETVTEF